MTPFPIDPVLTGITLAYANRRLIADVVLPRSRPMPRQAFNYRKWNLGEGFTLPNTKVGRKSAPEEVEFTGVRIPDETDDYGLDDVVPNDDIANAGEAADPLGRASEGLTDLLLLDREVRVAGLTFDAAAYPAANTVTLSGTSQWSDTSGTSDPIDDVMTGLDVPILRPNVMVIGRLAFTKLIMHPDINKAIHGTSGDKGVVRMGQIAELFELDEVVVGEGFINTAKRGQTVTLARAWGKHCLLLHRNMAAIGPNANQVTYGWTAQFGDRISGSLPEPKIGLRGSQRVRVGESVKELIAANDVAYFIEDAIA